MSASATQGGHKNCWFSTKWHKTVAEQFWISLKKLCTLTF